jgi:hypothetical protein
MASQMDGMIAMDNAEVMKGVLFLNSGFRLAQAAWSGGL